MEILSSDWLIDVWPMLFSISVTSSRNIMRSAILAGNVTSDCGPLGRHNRATMFRACSVTIYVAVNIISMSAAETNNCVPVNSLIHAKSDV